MNAPPLLLFGIVVFGTGLFGSFVAWWRILRGMATVMDLRSVPDSATESAAPAAVPSVFEVAFGPLRAEPPRVSGLVLVGSIAIWLLAQILVHALVFPPDDESRAAVSTSSQGASADTDRNAARGSSSEAAGAAADPLASKSPGKRLLALCGSQIATLLLVPWLLTGRWRRTLAEYGISLTTWPAAVRRGFFGFFVAIAPVILVLIASNPWRSVDKQNPLLQWLRQNPPPLLVTGIVLSATVLAPLVEELLFRVLAQGWFRQWMRPGWAIAVSSVAFALVHGWPDSVALVPLAVVLGQAYERTRSYPTVVTIHSTFNVFFLVLAVTLGSEPESGESGIGTVTAVRGVGNDSGPADSARATCGRSADGCSPAGRSVSSPASIAVGGRDPWEPRDVQQRDGRTWSTQHSSRPRRGPSSGRPTVGGSAAQGGFRGTCTVTVRKPRRSAWRPAISMRPSRRATRWWT